MSNRVQLLDLNLGPPTWTLMQNAVCWHVAASCGDLQRGGLLLAGIFGIVPLRAHNGCVRGDDESILPAANPNLLTRIRQSDMREAREEGNVPT